MKWLLAFLLTIIPVCAIANSPPLCAPRDKIVGALTQPPYQEEVASIALMGDGLIIERLQERNSWTLIVTNTDMISCVLATGEGWEEVPRPGT